MVEQCSKRVTWGVLVSSPLNGCRGCILADGWTALDFALHRGDQREGDCGCQHPRSHCERFVHSVATSNLCDCVCAQIRTRPRKGADAP